MSTTFQKTWCEIRLPNKDYKIILQYAPNCFAHFIYVYNSIASTYHGLLVDSFISSLRGLLRTCPDFFEVISDHSNETDFQALGFVKIEPSEKDVKLYTSLNQLQTS